MSRSPFAWIGAPSNVPDIGAWTQYLQAIRGDLAASWTSAKTAYLSLKKVRETLGLPFIDDSATAAEGGSAASHGAWTTDLETQAQDIQAMCVFSLKAIDDVLDGKRKLQWNQQASRFEIEQLKDDLLRIDQQSPNGAPIIVDAATGQQTHVTGQIGVPLIVYGATLVGSALALPVYLVVKAAAESMTDVAEQKTMQTIVERQFACVQSGKCTPEQAQALGTSVIVASKGLREAKAAEAAAKNKPESDWADTAKTLGWVALGIAGIYLVSKVVGAVGVRGQTSNLLPAHAENPTHRQSGDEQAATELELYLDNDSRFSMSGQGQGRSISKNLWRKWKKGTYDASQAPQAWSYVVESAAKAYAKEYGEAREWARMFNPATREMVAKSLADTWEQQARSGELDEYPP